MSLLCRAASPMHQCVAPSSLILFDWPCFWPCSIEGCSLDALLPLGSLASPNFHSAFEIRFTQLLLSKHSQTWLINGKIIKRTHTLSKLLFACVNFKMQTNKRATQRKPPTMGGTMACHLFRIVSLIKDHVQAM